MYTVYLDNAKFDPQGKVSYGELDTYPQQDVIMDHTVIAWNLLVSFEWDAEFEYMLSTEAGFRSFSNYLYDVTDGQMLLDTVSIFDDGVRWYDADMRIYASNMEHPSANTNGIRRVFQKRMDMPRRWFGDASLTLEHTLPSKSI